MSKEEIAYHNVLYFSQYPDFLRTKSQLSPLQIRTWKNNLCGLLCAYMVLVNFSNQKLTLAEFLELAKKENAYDSNKGWVHEKIVDLLQKYDINGKCLTVKNSELLIKLIEEGQLIIASVSPYYLDHSSKFRLIRRKSGHLVLIIRTEKSENGESNFVIHDPGSTVSEGRANIIISETSFTKKFSGKIMAFGRPNKN